MEWALPTNRSLVCAIACTVACVACAGSTGNGNAPVTDDDGGKGSPDGSIGGGQDGSLPQDGSATGDDASIDAGPPPQVVEVDHVCSSALHLKVAVLDDGVVRFHYVVNGAAQIDRGWVADLTQFLGAHAPLVADSATGLHVRTSAIDVNVTGATCAIAITSVPTGEALWAEAAPFSYGASVDGGASTGVSFAKTLATGEAIFGLGEKTGKANRRGRAFTMWNSDPAWSDPSGAYQTTSDPIYQSHPFFLSLPTSGHAIGAFLHNTHQTGFDVGVADPNTLAVTAAAGDADLFFFDGPTPDKVVASYSRLTGRAPLPPLWTLGYHQSRWTYTPQARVQQVALQFRQNNLPADGMWLDIDYMNGFRDFTWDPTNFADPAGMIATLANNGFKLTTIVDPGVKYDPGGTYASYNGGLAGNVFIPDVGGAPVQAPCWPGAAVFPDFTNPSVRTWWGNQIGTFMGAGVQGLWIDMNEPAVFQKSGFPLGATVNGDGQAATFDEVKNVYAMLMAKATREGQLAVAPNRRPFVLTRAGFAGSQRYAAVWTGDAQSTWDFLAMQPSMFQGMNVSGIPFVGSDVGGFTGGPSAELYGRWFEVGAFSPFFRTHSQTGSANQEPWAFGPEILDLAQRMLAVRYALLPYWYESFVATSTTGTPLVRPLWFDYPSDAEAQNHEDEYFVGASILVAPALAAGVATRPVYLPAGVFYDFYTGASYTGPATVTMNAPLGRIPVLVKAGSIVPEQNVVDYVGEVPDVPRHFDVYPGAAGTSTSLTLHEDDGETMEYAKGATSTTALALDVNATGLALTIGARSAGYAPPTPQSVDVRVHGVTAQPTAVTLNGASVAGATWSDSTRVLTIPIADFTAAQSIVVNAPSDLAQPRQVNVAFNVTLPAKTPANPTVYIASSAVGWTPNGTALTVSGTTATGTITVTEGTLVKYKLTRGAWTSVEGDGACADIGNREIVASWGANGTTSVSDTVGSWKDDCP